MSIRTLERIAILSLVAGLVSLAAAVGLLCVPAGAPAADVAAARATLSKAQVLRSETSRADERFDTLVEGLVASVGFDTPNEIAADLDHIQTARALEQALGRRTETTERSITQALGRANATLARIGTARPLVDASSGETRALGAAAALAAAALLLTAGTGLALRVIAVRRAELVHIAERLSIPLTHVFDGSLTEEVTIYAVKRTSLQQTVPPAIAPPPVRVVAAPEAPRQTPQSQERTAPRAAPNPAPAVARAAQAAPADDPTSLHVAPQEGPFLFNVEPLSRGSDD